jgi:streptogramin lyase
MVGIDFALDLVRNRGGRRKPAPFRPVLEGLEERRLLSTVNEFPVPTARSLPFAITAGSDGNLWFTEPGSNHIAMITLDGSVTEFAGPFVGNPTAITGGPDGNLWFGAGDGDTAIGRIAPDGSLTEFPIQGFENTVEGITAGPDGNVWFTEFDYPRDSSIGRITPDGQMTHFPLSGVSIAIGAITAGPDGNFWFSHLASGAFSSAIARITPDGAITDNLAPGVAGIAAGADGNLWGTGAHYDSHGVLLSGYIQRLTLDGQVTEFALPTATQPTMITAGPDGNLWFTEPDANQIGMITPGGQITEYPVPTPNSRPSGITAGPDGNVWFTELGSNQIGEFVLNDGGGAARSATARGALAMRAVAADALFTGAGQQAVDGVLGSQPSAVAPVDAAVAASTADSGAVPPGRQAQTEAGILPDPHQADLAVGFEDVGVADPLTEAL